jgi:two-component system, cell cycle sensor histidine kinase PleC
MSATRPLKIHAPRLETNALVDEGAARLILAMDGTIIYASEGFDPRKQASNLEGQNFLSFAEFIDHDDAFRQSPLLFAQDNALFAALRAGIHSIRIKSTDQVMSLQFDHISGQAGGRYVIASTIENDSRFNDSFESFLQKPERTTATFLNLSDDLHLHARIETGIDYINPKVSLLFGYSKEDVRGRSFLDLVHPDDKPSVRPLLQALWHGDDGDRLVEIECRMISNEARIFWVQWRHKREGSDIYSVGRDITAIKKHEQVLKRHEQQLLEAEAIGHMGHWHWSIGQDDLRFSDEIYRIFGVTRETFYPTLDTVNAMLHRRDAGRIMQAFQRAIIEQNDHDIDFRVITPDGQTRYVRCRGRCEKDNDGDVIGLYGIMQDITQTHLHEKALREAKEAAERAYATKSQFLANMSHELRTPLNAIIGFSEMIQQQLLGPIGNDRYLDYIKGIRESGEHLLDLVTDILDMSKIEAGKYELDLTTFNIVKVLRLAVHMMEGRAMDSGLKINVHLKSEDIPITADRRAVMQIILNILSNAMKFSHQNGVIDVECLAIDDHISLRIKDRGIGIPANKLGTITNPFEQVANQYTRSHVGSGLGLAITKELAELHGGSIHIDSAMGVGTTVTIRLPQTTVRS